MIATAPCPRGCSRDGALENIFVFGGGEIGKKKQTYSTDYMAQRSFAFAL